VRETFKPMTLANMRLNGVRAVIATCEACGHKADVNVELPERAIRLGRFSLHDGDHLL
jgi:hypothetical protein